MGVSAWAIAPKEQGLLGLTNLPAENLVRSRGLEPPRLAALAPQASASASSATTAMTPIVKAMVQRVKRVVGKFRNASGRPPRRVPGYTPALPLERLVRVSWLALGLVVR